jgi:hypothetical protein
MGTFLMKIVATRDHFLRRPSGFHVCSTGDCGGFLPNPQMVQIGRRISSSVA